MFFGKAKSGSAGLQVADAIEVFIDEFVVMLRCRGVHKGDVAVEVDIRIQSALDKQLHRLGQHGVLQINGGIVEVEPIFIGKPSIWTAASPISEQLSKTISQTSFNFLPLLCLVVR